jgi:uncharacterized membrane protein
MSKLLVVVFDKETQAYEGQSALKDLHRAGDITLYSTAVVVKDSSGNVSVKKPSDAEPIGTGIGLLTGSLLGLIGGPVGMAIGAAAGGWAGVMFDLANAGIGADFLAEASAALEPDCAAVVAEVDEAWVTPVDVRMGKLGGRVLRRPRLEFVSDMLRRDAEALGAEFNALQAELDEASAEHRAALQARVDQARKDLEALQVRVEAKQAEIQEEMASKIDALREQAKTAGKARQAQIEERSAQIKADYEARRAKLDQAGMLIKEALNPKVHA